jgi:hypothetical protein
LSQVGGQLATTDNDYVRSSAPRSATLGSTGGGKANASSLNLTCDALIHLVGHVGYHDVALEEKHHPKERGCLHV